MSVTKELLAEKCDDLVCVLQNELRGANPDELFKMAQEGLMSGMETEDVFEAVVNNFCFDVPLPWQREK